MGYLELTFADYIEHQQLSPLVKRQDSCHNVFVYLDLIIIEKLIMKAALAPVNFALFRKFS